MQKRKKKQSEMNAVTMWSN